MVSLCGNLQKVYMLSIKRAEWSQFYKKIEVSNKFPNPLGTVVIVVELPNG